MNLTVVQEHRLQDWRFEKPRARTPLYELACLGHGRHLVPRNDLLDLYGSWFRDLDPEIYLHVGDKLPTLDEAPDRSGYDAWSSSYRRLSNDLLVPKGVETIERMIAGSSGWIRDLLTGLRVDEDNIAVPVGMEELAFFCIMVSDSRHIVHAATPTIDIYSASGTFAWTNPGTAYGFIQYQLIGGGANGGGGARVTTLSNDAGGGGGGGGGGYRGRVGNMSAVSNGNMVVAALQSTAGGSQASTNTNGVNGTDGNSSSFNSVTASGGTKGTGGTQGSGAQTGTGGAGGVGDIAGSAGGTGRSGGTVGDNAADQTTGPGGAGGGGGGGATADTAESNGGRGGRGWQGAALHGTVGGGAAGTAGNGSGGAPTAGTGSGAGGGGGCDESITAGGTGGSADGVANGFGGGGGGGGGRARNASNQSGNGASSGHGAAGFGMITGL